MKGILKLSLVLWAVSGVIGQSYATTHPVCEYTASDYDGDGWGWENNQSCQVTDKSHEKPVFLNLNTGTEVSLTRPYWNAYRDFENRTVRCDLYVYDQCDYFGQPGLCGNTASISQGGEYSLSAQQIYDPKRGTPESARVQQVFHYGLPVSAPWQAIQRTVFVYC